MSDSTIDVISIVENNPLIKFNSKDYESRMIDKIRNNFTDKEQQLFVANFYCYLNYDTRKDFIVKIDDIWKWLGYGRVNEIKTVLTKNFTENVDYKIEKPALEDAKAAPSQGGSGLNREHITITVHCFKKLCLKAKTKKAEEIHDYFLRLEEIINEVVYEQSEELKTQLRIRNKKIVDINEFDQKPMVYLIDMNVIVDGEKLYRIGYTSDIHKRFNKHSLFLRKDIKHDITFKNGWLFEHIETAIEVETLVKRYMRSEKILYKYRSTSNEIMKTNNIGLIEDLITKWADECRENYKKNKKVDVRDKEIELLKIKKELMEIEKELIEKKLEAKRENVDIEPMFITVPEPKEEKEPKKLKKKKEIKQFEPEIDSSFIKCMRCGCSKSIEEYAINPNSERPYSYCEDCRKSESEKNMLKNKEKREKNDSEYKEKMKKVEELRENLLNGPPVKCSFCKTEKSPKEIGVNKRVNQLYKVCAECRSSKESVIENSSECGKCRHQFETEINPKTNIEYKTCKECREKDKKNLEYNRSQLKENTDEIVECSGCKKDFPKTLNAKKDGFYKKCQACRDLHKKYDRKKYYDNRDEILAQKREYYNEHNEQIRADQKEYYDFAQV
jgi:predicted GIY-YIG superfamily endonuclease